MNRLLRNLKLPKVLEPVEPQFEVGRRTGALRGARP
jgi:hypothetical protein